MKNQIKIKFLLIILLLLFTSTLASCQNNDKQNAKSSSNANNGYVLKLINNELFLINIDKAIKKYEINPMVLPSEDILLLIEGIKVEDEKEADSIAENFDG